MGVVKFSDGIQYVKGSLAKPVKKSGHSHGDYLIATHREAATTNPNCSRLYIRQADRYKRSTPAMADELAARARFTAVSRAVRLRAKDLMQINADQAAFLAQRDTANGKKTMTSYLWMLEGAKYDTEHGQG